MAILNINHVNIGTNDLAATEAFFRDGLGLEAGWRPDFSFPGLWLYAGDRAIVHLVGLEKGRGASTDSALDHFAFEIDDYDQALARLIAAGLPFRELAVPGAAIRQIFLRDPNGVAIELNYPIPRASVAGE